MADGRSKPRRLMTGVAVALCLALVAGAPRPAPAQPVAAAPAPATMSVAESRAAWKALDRRAEALLTIDGSKPGQDALAISTGRDALALAEKAFGPDDPATLTSMERLASLMRRYWGINRDDLRERIVATRTRIQGRTHPDTRRALRDLAASYGYDNAKSTAVYRELVEIARATDGPLSRATLRARYDLAFNLAQFKPSVADAERQLREVLAEQTRLFGAKDIDTGHTAGGLASLYYGQSRFLEAEPFLKIEVETALKEYGPKDDRSTIPLGFLGLLYDRQGRFDEAEQAYRRAYDLDAAAYGPDDRRALSHLQRVAEIVVRTGRSAEAETLFDRVCTGYRKAYGEVDSQSLRCLLQLEDLYRSQGRYQEADETLKHALEISDKLPADGFFSENTIRLRLAASLRMQGKTEEARRLTDQILAIWQRDRERAPDGEYEGFYDQRVAALLCEGGRTAEGILLYRKTLAAKEKVRGSDNPEVLGVSLELANCLNAGNMSADALPLLQHALEVRERLLGRDHPDTIRTVNSLAIAHQNVGRLADAVALFKRAAESARAAFGPSHPETLTIYQNYLSALNLAPDAPGDRVAIARAVTAGLRSLFQVKESAGAAQATAETARRLRAEQFLQLPDALWTRGLSGQKLSPGEFDEVYAALQDAVSGSANRALTQAMVRRAAAGRSSEVGALVRQRQDLIASAEESDAELVRTAASTDELAATRRANLQKARVDFATQVADVDRRLHAGFPEFFDILQSTPAGLADTQRALGEDEAILLVMASDAGTHVMAISRSDVRWVRSPWTRAQVGRAVTRLLWDVGADVRVDPATEHEWEAAAAGRLTFNRATAYALYGQVVAPVNGVLAGKRLVYIAAGGSLTGLPFGVLVTAPTTGSDADAASLRATPWFADAHALTVIPSIQSLLFQRRVRAAGAPSAQTGLSFSGYGDPVLEGAAQTRGGPRPVRGLAVQAAFQPGVARSGAGVADVSQLKRLARLPGTAIELEGMRQALGAPPASLHLGDAASETALKHADLSGVRILAFATHGLMAGEVSRGSEPGLVLTPPGQATADDDGLLTASEVAALKLDADWVILSACNTAAGDGSAGAPGLSGLARGFFYAGARSLLVSHWPVRDDVAARLTVAAVKLRQANPALSRAEALQQAMRAIREDRAHDTANDTWAHPEAWAPFSLVSDGAQ